MFARMLLAVFLITCLILEVRSKAARPAEQIRPVAWAELNSANALGIDLSDSGFDRTTGAREENASFLTEAVHWVYLAYNERAGSIRQPDRALP